MKNKLLLFAYFYPPLGGPAVQRPLKTIKYLKEAGWEVDVISVQEIVYHSRDESLLQEECASAVYRTGSADVMSKLKKVSGKTGVDPKKIYFKTPEFFKRLVRSSYVIDDKIGWLKYAVKQGKQLCEKNQYKAVMATIGPYTSALAAYRIHQEYDLPIIIDYRDHWTLNPYIKYLTPLHRRSARRWEKRILKNSTLILTIGKKLAAELKKEFGGGIMYKLHVMYNGYDEDDFKDTGSIQPPDDKFVISYLGGLYGKRSAEFFLQAVTQLKTENKLPNDLLIRFVGNYYRETQTQLASEKLKDILELIPQVEHHEALKLMCNSHLLLLFSPSDSLKSGVTGKIFEYLRSGRKIFGMVPSDSESAILLREHGQNTICAMEDVEQIKKHLLEFFRDRDQLTEISAKEKYSRKNQVKKFADKLGELL